MTTSKSSVAGSFASRRTTRAGVGSGPINTVDAKVIAWTDRSITADDVTTLLDELVAQHGVPTYLRMDNGPEFAAYAIRDWCRFNGSSTTFIDPGSPPLTGHVESFNSRLRDEFLNGQLFDSLLEAQALLEVWRHEYNHHRLHSSLCYLTPVEFKELRMQQNQERLSLEVAH